ncbi:MAG: GntR family transcriptional regulator [Rhodospirillaceae bacterium]|nr:GntR family transcriptional regulator [Rhodospirillaceae bacterium]|tara:strand:+ start:144 stop:830 length:687 start_codon:yes stop_codon:yes gene_type:complete
MDSVEAIIQPIEDVQSLKDRTYVSLKQAITAIDIYANPEEPRLDERELSSRLGVSRTPVREAIARLEQEGLVRIAPRKGVFVVRKPKQEILQMITVWAALESMAARLITLHASEAEIASLRILFASPVGDQAKANIDEYSDRNIRFHQAIISMSKCDLLVDMADNLFIHMRAIRAKTISENDRVSRSIIDHMNIIEALEQRNTELAEKLARQHTLDLAAHVEKNVHYL